MLIIPILVLTGIFILNLTVGMYYGFGVRHYWFFETLHFLGGFFIAMFLSNFFYSTASILIGLGIVTFLWESLEVVIARIPLLTNYVKKKLRQKDVTPGFGDTIFDIILNIAGALVFLYLTKLI